MDLVIKKLAVKFCIKVATLKLMNNCCVFTIKIDDYIIFIISK